MVGAIFRRLQRNKTRYGDRKDDARCGVTCRDHPTQTAPRVWLAGSRGGCLNEKQLLCDG